MGGADRIGGDFGQAIAADLALFDQAGEGADDFLQRAGVFAAVDVEQVHMVAAEAFQGLLQFGAEVGFGVVDPPLGVGDEAGLGGEGDLRLAAGEPFA